MPAAAIPVAVEAAEFAGAHSWCWSGRGAPLPRAFQARALVLEAPAEDPDGAFAALVGGYAAGLAAGESPADAFAAARGASWERPVA